METGLDLLQFREAIVVPTLERIGMNSLSAVQLLLGTAAQESNFKYLYQLGGGPALGLYQMEPATHDDIWQNYLSHRANHTEVIMQVSKYRVPDELAWNLNYATAMCRMHYYRVPEGLPEVGDVEGLAKYWKQHYNTELGKGTTGEFVDNYHRFGIDKL